MGLAFLFALRGRTGLRAAGLAERGTVPAFTALPALYVASMIAAHRIPKALAGTAVAI